MLSIWSAGASAQPIGEVISGTQSPSLGIGLGLGSVKPEFAKAGTAIPKSRSAASASRQSLCRSRSTKGDVHQSCSFVFIRFQPTNE